MPSGKFTGSEELELPVLVPSGSGDVLEGVSGDCPAAAASRTGMAEASHWWVLKHARLLSPGPTAGSDCEFPWQ